ncbi:pantoate--beta-alanine ligase [candidate division WOR-3 bacterium]|nr:pantoate--beta-alanine ligase [candidate division WOR-3 bacterium]
MRVIQDGSEMTEISDFYKEHGLILGFVPTMGCLHQGHISLFKCIEEKCDAIAASIYVNPMQFRPGEDFEKYPRDRIGDLEKLQNVCDYVFLPDDKQIYPSGFSTFVEVESLSKKLCGVSRPGHFRGVTTVVARLFGIVRPKLAAFGQKDYQQFVIIRRMTEDLALGVQLFMCPIVRDKDGLAMSSRNRYLSKKERIMSLAIRKSILYAREEIMEKGILDLSEIKKKMIDIMSENGVKVDYAEIVDPATLESVENIQKRAVIAVAGMVGSTRLIDNEIIDLEEK